MALPMFYVKQWTDFAIEAQQVQPLDSTPEISFGDFAEIVWASRTVFPHQGAYHTDRLSMF